MPQSVSPKEENEVSQITPETPELSSNGKNDKNELEELRKILVQPEEVSEVLPSALKKSSQKDTQLAEATLPIVEENIRQSVKRNPRTLAEALFPVIGPAIRKAIAEALSSMVQSLNQTLEYSFSPRGLKWRLEAWQTGKSFGEVVMLNTLLYRVEQVFLIHKKTGILLQHVAADQSISEDADMVSAMLTAIQDFVHDSFHESEDATLDALKVKELSVWIENSPDAVLAAVIRGNAPLNLREVFVEALEKIQFEQETDLAEFEGDPSVFEKSRPILSKCLQFQIGETASLSPKILKPVNIIAAILGVLLLIGGIFYVRDYWRWSSFLNRLKAEQGIVVTDAERGWLTHTIAGLRDNLAVNPSEILPEYNFAAGDIEQNWKPYQDLSPKFIVQRAEKLLHPPNGVKFGMQDGILIADGDFSNEWFNEAAKFAPLLAGVGGFSPGRETLKNKIEAQNIFFICNTTDFTENQAGTIEELVRNADHLSNLAAVSEKNFQIEILGHASESGTAEINYEISQKRAEKIISELAAKSSRINELRQFLKPVGLGASQTNTDCKVTFRVNLE